MPARPAARGARLWLSGARPRTLGAAVAPVLVGTAAAAPDGPTIPWRAGAALVVALALQVGANYANDYSDGVRGADEHRSGPRRLTASGLVPPAAVRRAATGAFAVAAATGLVLAVAVDPRLLFVGAATIAAGVLYTGGPRPYGYAGLGELAVLVFFGLVATCGSAYVQLGFVPAVAWPAAGTVGLLACALLLANNIRDADTDAVSGKRTLAVRVGVRGARRLFATCVLGAFAPVGAVAPTRPWGLLALTGLPLAIRPVRLVLTRRDEPPALIAALGTTARLEIVVGVLLAVGLWLG